MCECRKSEVCQSRIDCDFKIATEVSNASSMAFYKELQSELIKLAAEMLVHAKRPSTFIDDHEHKPKTVPTRWWREICGGLIEAENQRKDWAVRIRKIADSL